MAIFQGDVFFRRVIELILKDLRANPWLVDDILSDFVSDPMLSQVYGQKEIQNAKKWLNDTDIGIFLAHRMDLEKMPCITISIGQSNEDKSLATLADQTPFIEEFTSSEVGQSIAYIIQPFDYVSYDQATGFIKVPDSVDLLIVQPGMVVVDPDTGNGWVISSKNNEGIFIAKNSVLSNTSIGIIPEYRVFRARKERATFQKRITIGCHAHGDPSTLLWLHSFIMYGLLRYREGAIESRNFQLSNIETSDMVRNSNFDSFGENVYSKFITLSGQVENTWIKAPKRVIEAIELRDFEGIELSGLVIVNEDGGEVPEIIDSDDEPWVAKD